MRGILYYIDNTVNNKIYIGITYSGLDIRWKRHLNKVKNGTSKLYKAMREIGISNFNIHIIDEYDQGKLEAAETYYITKYDTVNNGYNTPYGGEAHTVISENAYNSILEDLQLGELSLIDIAGKNKVSMTFLKRIAYNEGIDIYRDIVNNVTNKPIKVVCIDLDHKYIREFESMQKAYKWTKLKLGKEIKEGHFYYQIKYAINTGNIAYRHFWFKAEHLDNRIKNSNMITISLKYENTNRKLYDSGLRYKGAIIYTVNQEINSEISKVNQKEHQKSKKPYEDRQVPDNIKIRYPLEKEQLAELYPKYTINSIAKHAGLSYTTVNKHIKNFGLKY